MVSGPASVTFTDPRSPPKRARSCPRKASIASASPHLTVASPSTLDIELTVRSDLEGITRAGRRTARQRRLRLGHGEPEQRPTPPGIGFGSSECEQISAMWPTPMAPGRAREATPYTVLGSAAEGGAIRGVVQHNPRGASAQLSPPRSTGQRWVTLLVRLNSGFTTIGHTAVFLLAAATSYSWGGINGFGFGFRQDGSALRLVAMEQSTSVATSDVRRALANMAPRHRQGPRSIPADPTASPCGQLFRERFLWPHRKSSLGEPRSHRTPVRLGGDSIQNLWVGALPFGQPPIQVSMLMNSRVSTEGGDRGLGQVIAEKNKKKKKKKKKKLDAGIQIACAGDDRRCGPVPARPSCFAGSHRRPIPTATRPPSAWGGRVVSGPGTVLFSDPAALAPTATFPSAGSYVLRLPRRPDGAVTPLPSASFTTGGPHRRVLPAG